MKTKVRQLTDVEYFTRRERFFKLIDKMKAKPWHCLLLSFIVILGDYLTGPGVQFPFLYIIPVSMAAWGSNKKLAYSLALLLPASRITTSWTWGLPVNLPDSGINLSIRFAVLAGIVYLLLFIQDLRFLRGILHACSYCHRVETDKGEWKTTEEFVTEYSEAMFSHGICPDCSNKYWGSLTKAVTKGGC